MQFHQQCHHHLYLHKRIKNTHSLATHIYERGLQILTDAKSKVERLQARQHLTAMLIPPTMVNVMSQEEDHCFQCQKQGHIALHFPSVLDVLSVTNTVIS